MDKKKKKEINYIEQEHPSLDLPQLRAAGGPFFKSAHRLVGTHLEHVFAFPCITTNSVAPSAFFFFLIFYASFFHHKRELHLAVL